MMFYSLLLLLVIYLSSAKETPLDKINVQPNEQYLANYETRIYNGNNATEGQFPYQSLLFMLLSDGNLSFCGGSLIKTNVILTAAHCCVNVTKIRVYLGLKDFNDRNRSFVQKFEVNSSGIVAHEDYNPETIANDICLLKLPNNASLNSNVSTVALPSSPNQDPAQYDFHKATISGFGQTEDAETIHPYLQWSNVIMKPHVFCRLTYIFINKVETSHLCSGKIPWTGPCRGDSGGPLVVRNSSGEPVEIGLVSWGVGGCASLNPVVYTYVPYFLDWIKANL